MNYAITDKIIFRLTASFSAMPISFILALLAIADKKKQSLFLAKILLGLKLKSSFPVDCSRKRNFHKIHWVETIIVSRPLRL